VGSMSIPFFFSYVPSPSIPVIAPPLFHPFPSVLLFPFPVKFSKEVWSAFLVAQKKWQPVVKVGGDQIRLVPGYLQSWRERVPGVPQCGCACLAVNWRALRSAVYNWGGGAGQRVKTDLVVVVRCE